MTTRYNFFYWITGIQFVWCIRVLLVQCFVSRTVRRKQIYLDSSTGMLKDSGHKGGDWPIRLGSSSMTHEQNYKGSNWKDRTTSSWRNKRKECIKYAFQYKNNYLLLYCSLIFLKIYVTIFITKDQKFWPEMWSLHHDNLPPFSSRKFLAIKEIHFGISTIFTWFSFSRSQNKKKVILQKCSE